MKANNCGECPYFYSERDYWGEVTEECKCNRKFDSGRCYLPIIIRSILNFKYRIKDYIAFKKMEMAYKKEQSEWKNNKDN